MSGDHNMYQKQRGLPSTQCPNCERYKLSASMWRNEAYKHAGTPLPWKPDELWVGLTDEEIEQVCIPLGAAMLSFPEVARAIEAKLKEKNT